MVGIVMLRLPTLLERIGEGRSSAYRKVKAGLLPPPVKLSERSSAWPAHEIDEVLRARIAGASDQQIGELVKRLVAQRSEQRPAA